MFYRGRIVFVMLLAAILAGCISVPRVDADSATLREIKTIAIVRQQEPDTYLVSTHQGLAGGGAVGLIFVPFLIADRSTNQSRLADEFKKIGISIMPRLVDALAVNLRGLGFLANVVDGSGKVNNGNNTISPDRVSNDVDATLIVSPMAVGFVAKYGRDVTPIIRCEVTLMGRNKGLLYRGFHQTGGLDQTYQANAGWRIGFTDKSFANIDAVFADIPAAATSLRDAASAMAETIAADLGR